MLRTRHLARETVGNRFRARFSCGAPREGRPRLRLSPKFARKAVPIVVFCPLKCASTKGKVAFYGRECAETDTGTALRALERAQARGGYVFCPIVDVRAGKELLFAVSDGTEAGVGPALRALLHSIASGDLLFTVSDRVKARGATHITR